MFIHNDDLTNEEQKKKMRKEINELNRIRRELDKYNEEREKI